MSRVERICISYRQVSRVCKGRKHELLIWYWLWWEALSFHSVLTCHFPSTCLCSSAGSNQLNWDNTEGFRFWAPWHTPRLHQGSGCLGKSCPACVILCFAKLLPNLESVPGACFIVWVNRVQRCRCRKINFWNTARQVWYCRCMC